MVFQIFKLVVENIHRLQRNRHEEDAAFGGQSVPVSRTGANGVRKMLDNIYLNQSLLLVYIYGDHNNTPYSFY